MPDAGATNPMNTYPPPSSLQKLWHMTWSDRRLLVEALASIAVARFFVAFVSFRRLAFMLSRSPLPGTHRDSDQIVQRVRWAIQVWASRVPWRAMCFEQGLAAHLMLRRRGVDSVLYYGAAPNLDGRLAAHVWVLYKGTNVVGAEIASQFAVLATFPRQANDPR
jgi:hypothetical protein